MPKETRLCSVLTTDEIVYDPFCDDFGPMNMLAIVNFIRLLERQADDGVSDAIVYIASAGPRSLTNAAFLLGTYMLIVFEMAPAAIIQRFVGLDPTLLEPYRDASFNAPNFGLTLLDCWSGIQRAMEHRWLARPSKHNSQLWGRINIAEYAQYDEPLNADLHEVIPGKLVAFRGPRDLGGATYRDVRSGVRHFAPSFFVPVLRELGVTAVLQLEAPAYDPTPFTAAGMAHHSIPFQDSAAPTPAVVTRFFQVADAAPGPVAVHCASGLGRTGTLAGLYLMRRYGFTAREAMGWLRVMRPGSVIGEQQHFLLAVERRLRAPRPAPAPGAPRAPPAGGGRLVVSDRPAGDSGGARGRTASLPAGVRPTAAGPGIKVLRSMLS